MIESRNHRYNRAKHINLHNDCNSIGLKQYLPCKKGHYIVKEISINKPDYY